MKFIELRPQPLRYLRARRSLDEENEDGLGLIDNIEDPDAYEEMERAAEAAYSNENWPFDEPAESFG